MLVTNSVHFTDSNHDTHFITAIAAYASGTLNTMPASEYADIQIVEGNPATAGNDGKLVVKSVRILSLEEIKWRVEFFDRSVPNATPASFTNWGLLGSYDGVHIGGPQPTTYYATAYKHAATVFVTLLEQLDLPIMDRTGQGQLHVRLSNIGNVAKSAGNVGAVHLRVGTIFAS